MADYGWFDRDYDLYDCCGGAIPKHLDKCIYVRGFQKEYSGGTFCRGCGCTVIRLDIHEQEKVCQPLQDLLREERRNRERKQS